jgi:signal transduction histidine kinase
VLAARDRTLGGPGATEAALLEKIEELSFLRTLNDRLASVPDFASACRALVDMLWEERHASCVAYVSVDPQRQICRLEASAPGPADAAGELAIDLPPFDRLLAATEPVVLADSPPLPWFTPGTGMALVCAPMQVREATTGLLLFVGDGDPDRLEEHRRLLAIVATSAALALDVARREAREEFLAMLRHDINNPVAVALGYMEMMVDRLHDGERGELCRLASSITESLKAVADLVSNYLHMAAIDRGTPWLHREPVDLLVLVREAVEQLGPAATERDVAVAIHGGHVGLRADRRQLSRVVLNLVGNAVKYTPAGGRVDVRVAHDGGDGLLVVADTGYGIAPADLARVFEKYARFHRHLGIPGTGLGLFLSKAIVEAHGGRIAVSSTPGRGTAFTVRMPRTA